MIRKEYLDKFKKLYQDKYNIILDDEQATELATHFLNLMEILIKPKAIRKNAHSGIATRRDYATR